MAVLVGYCDHGFEQAALMEEYATDEQLEEMAVTYRLERVESVTLTMERCPRCQLRYEINMELIRSKREAQQ